MTSAAIYARVSSARQAKDETIGSQLAALREHAAQSRLEVPALALGLALRGGPQDRKWPLTCGAKGTRTPGLLDANQTLFQLSYSPGCLPTRVPGAYWVRAHPWQGRDGSLQTPLAVAGTAA